MVPGVDGRACAGGARSGAAAAAGAVRGRRRRGVAGRSRARCRVLGGGGGGARRGGACGGGALAAPSAPLGPSPRSRAPGDDGGAHKGREGEVDPERDGGGGGGGWSQEWWEEGEEFSWGLRGGGVRRGRPCSGTLKSPHRHPRAAPRVEPVGEKVLYQTRGNIFDAGLLLLSQHEGRTPTSLERHDFENVIKSHPASPGT